MKKLVSLITALLLVLSLSSFAMADETVTITIAADVAPHMIILEEIADDMLALGYKLELLSFTDYSLYNMALAEGQMDANYFQHLPYLDAYNATADEANQLVPAIGMHYEPFGVYAGQTKSLEELKDGAIITVPNDASNETRALLLLQEAGLITLPEGATARDMLTVMHIVDNPKNLDIREMDASQLPASLEDADLAVINGNYALSAGLSPTADALIFETNDSEAATVYTNYLVVRPEDVEAEWVEALRTCLCTQEMYDFMLALTDTAGHAGGVVPTFAVPGAEADAAAAEATAAPAK